MGSFSAALTGLQADTVALNTIGNNLANINTTAYKGQTAEFEDLFYQQIGMSGSNNPIQVGVGTKVSGTTTNFLHGTIETTSNSNDMALNGDGFFVIQQNGVQSLTRAGNFQLSNSGALITVDGNSVMGYGMDNGNINTNGSLVPLRLPVGSTQPAQATQNIAVIANLNSGSPIGDQETSPIAIYDSLGTGHNLTITYTKTGANTWDYSINLPAGEETGAPANNTGTLTFDTNGNLVSPTDSVTGIQFTGLADGASDLNLTWNVGSSDNPTITQTNSASTTTRTLQNGYPSGSYDGFSVDSSGVITASFSNGNLFTVGQVAVATVTNEQGLARTGNNNYLTTAASGGASIGVAGTGGRGTIEDSALEDSNVDISTEFAHLIVAQRAFEANSKTITTLDSLTQATLGMIR
jgi:flagellar hook protein FlgE